MPYKILKRKEIQAEGKILPKKKLGPGQIAIIHRKYIGVVKSVSRKKREVEFFATHKRTEGNTYTNLLHPELIYVSNLIKAIREGRLPKPRKRRATKPIFTGVLQKRYLLEVYPIELERRETDKPKGRKSWKRFQRFWQSTIKKTGEKRSR